jgi:hypothetical protein
VTTLARAKTVAELMAKVGTLFAYLDQQSVPFTPRSDDVIISPYAKCGTTWLQQTFHTLRTRGDTDFDDISRVVPWIETSPGLGLDLNAEQKANPRGFKSHLSWDAIPKGGKYIVSFRDPRDAAVSLYRFFEGLFFEPGAIDKDDFVQNFYLQRALADGYWRHLVSWWSQRKNPNVLLLSFEGMKAQPEMTIRRVAEFSGIALDDELLAITLCNSSLEFMKAHKEKFDDLLMREKSEEISNLPPGSDAAKVREGSVGAHKAELSEQALAALDARWQEEVSPALGFPDYADFQRAVQSL